MAVDYSSGSVRIQGLSGMDTNFDEMIDKLYDVESLHAQQLIRWRKDWETRQEAFKELRAELVNMQTSLKKLNSPGKFLSKYYTSSHPSRVTATLTADSPIRDFNINVEQLATSASMSFQTTLASATEQFGDGAGGKLKVGLGDNEVFEIVVTPETTLEGVVNMINNHPKNKGVSASVLKTIDGYALQVRSNKPGLTTLDIEVEGTNPFAGAPVDKVEGKNAIFTMDGSNFKIESSSNMVSDVVEGITFNLYDVGSANISVKLDKDGIKENVESFVEAVNNVRTKIKELTQYDSSKQVIEPEYADSQFDMQQGSVLTGNYGVQIMSSTLRSITASQGLGFVHGTDAYAGDVFSALSQIGIMTNANEGSDNYGLLEINEIKQADSITATMSLDEALDKDAEAVARLFAATLDPTVHNQGEFGYHSSVGGITGAGTFDVKYSIDENGVLSNVTVGGKKAQYNAETQQITALEGEAKGLVLTVFNFEEGEYDGKVSLRRGKVNELLDALQGDGTQEGSKMLDKRYGSLSILEDEYTTIIKNINKKIIAEDERLLVWERRMRARFARLEATLAEYNQINESLKSQIESMSPSSK